MKKLIVLSLVPLISVAAPVVEDNPQLPMLQATAAWKASTNYVSESNFVALVEASSKFDELKAAILAKAKSDKDKADKEAVAKEKAKK